MKEELKLSRNTIYSRLSAVQKFYETLDCRMNEEERKEILELLRAEEDKTAEEHRRGEHFMDEIEKYANTLNEEEKRLFYEDLNERWNHVLREESKRLSKLWK